MNHDLKFLRKFPKDDTGLYIVYDLYTFDNLFRLLLKSDMEHDEALDFVIGNCSLSGIVFQERIHNKGYEKISSADALPPVEAASKARFIHDMMEMASKH